MKSSHYNTGKVKIGERYIPKPPQMDKYDEQIQEGLLGIRSWKHTLIYNVVLYCFVLVCMVSSILFWVWVGGDK
jgi:hypothetical protein